MLNAGSRRHMADATLALHALANICKKNRVLSDGRLSFFFNAMNLLSLHLVGVESFIGTLFFRLQGDEKAWPPLHRPMLYITRGQSLLLYHALQFS